MKRIPLWMIVLLFVGTAPPPTFAADPELPNFDLPDFDIGELFPDSLLGPFTRTFGYLTSHRSYHGASGLGSPGIEFGLEATLVHFPSDFTLSGLTGDSSSGSESALPIQSLPMAKIQLHKSFNRLLDFGASGLYWPGLLMLGIEGKLLLWQPEEGLHFALRMQYSIFSIDFGALGLGPLEVPPGDNAIAEMNIILKTQNINPQIVASKRLDFAEPYIGAGYNWIRGQIDLPISLNVADETQTLSTTPYTARGYDLFTGVVFRVPIISLMISMEGAYSSLGMHRIGTVVGMSF